jgi:hypothetical protein
MRVSLRQLKVVLVQKGTPLIHKLKIWHLILKALTAA